MIHLTAAFASEQHARDAIRFIVGSSLALTARPRPSGKDTDMALVDFEVAPPERDRLATLLTGVHGFVVEETRAIEAAVA